MSGLFLIFLSTCLLIEVVNILISKWALKNTTRLRNVNRLKAYIQSVSDALHKFM